MRSRSTKQPALPAAIDPIVVSDGWSARVLAGYVHVTCPSGAMTMVYTFEDILGRTVPVYSHFNVGHDLASAIVRLGGSVTELVQPTREELRKAKRLAFAAIALVHAES